MAKIQQLAKDGTFGAQFKSIANCDPLLCKACLHDKHHKKPIISATIQTSDISHLEPGGYISGDPTPS
jgi:hypothetical protein